MAILPNFDAATFSNSTNVTNPYFPLPPGTINSYSAATIDPETSEVSTERNDHFATFDTRTIEGVKVVVVRDTAYADGSLVEDTLDWYAQDDSGNVWYLGEIAANYNYNDDGQFIGADFGGSWEAGVAGASPGWIMRANPMPGDSYFQEFAAGIAQDEGLVVATNLKVNIGFGSFSDVIKILDTSSLDPGLGSFKYFAPGIGQVKEEEIVIGEPDPDLVSGLVNRRMVDISAPVDPTELVFAGSGTTKTVTFINEDGSTKSAIGAYFFDPVTGVIGEARILFADTSVERAGAKVTLTVPAGMSLGLFMIPDIDTIGIDLEDYAKGGLFFRNFQTGNVAALFDGDDATNYTPGPASIFDRTPPVVAGADGNLLPVRAFHSVGNRHGFNFLNPVAGENAAAADLDIDADRHGKGDDDDDDGGGNGNVSIISFEDGLASTPDFDGDFDDAFIAVSDEALSRADVKALREATGISRKVGTDRADRLAGTGDEDQLMGLAGKDIIKGRDGDDQIVAGKGSDLAFGAVGDDKVFGEAGHDRLYGGKGNDTIEGGEGNDWLIGGQGKDELFGDEGNDRLFGGKGTDNLNGGEGSDRLWAGRGGGRMSGGVGDDILYGEARARDVFVFDLISLGGDLIRRFENGKDRIEIATYMDVASFDDIEVEQQGKSTVLSFAEGDVEIFNFKSVLIDASDFVLI